MTDAERCPRSTSADTEIHHSATVGDQPLWCIRHCRTWSFTWEQDWWGQRDGFSPRPGAPLRERVRDRFSRGARPWPGSRSEGPRRSCGSPASPKRSAGRPMLALLLDRSKDDGYAREDHI
jgi:hypothetical protein